VSGSRTDVPVGGWDPDTAAAAEFERVRLEALAELELLKAELRERALRIAEREAELDGNAPAPATDTPEEELARRARELADAERAALAELDARARALDLRARDLSRREHLLDTVGPVFDPPGFAGFSEGFEAFAEHRRKRQAPGR